MRVGCGVRAMLEGTQPGGRGDGQRRRNDKPAAAGVERSLSIESKSDLFIGWKVKGKSRTSI